MLKDRSLLGICFLGFVLSVLEFCSAVWCSAADAHLKLLDRAVSGARFLTEGVFVCDIAHRRSVAVMCMLYKIRWSPMHLLMVPEEQRNLEEQRDLGITITRDLKWQKQTEKNCKTPNTLLGFIARNFNYKSTVLMLPLYKSIVRPHLEYLVDPTWNIWTRCGSGHHIYV